MPLSSCLFVLEMRDRLGRAFRNEIIPVSSVGEPDFYLGFLQKLLNVLILAEEIMHSHFVHVEIRHLIGSVLRTIRWSIGVQEILFEIRRRADFIQISAAFIGFRIGRQRNLIQLVFDQAFFQRTCKFASLVFFFETDVDFEACLEIVQFILQIKVIQVDIPQVLFNAVDLVDIEHQSPLMEVFAQ